MSKKLIFVLSIMIIVILIVIAMFVISSLTKANDDEKDSISNTNINSIIENNQENTERCDDMKLYIKVNNKTLIATLNDNSSVKGTGSVEVTLSIKE